MGIRKRANGGFVGCRSVLCEEGSRFKSPVSRPRFPTTARHDLHEVKSLKVAVQYVYTLAVRVYKIGMNIGRKKVCMDNVLGHLALNRSFPSIGRVVVYA